VAGAAVKLAEADGCALKDLALQRYQSIDARIHEGVYAVLSASASMQSRVSYGGAAPVRVKEQVTAWKARLGL
jgi:argininosuccinate lyase